MNENEKLTEVNEITQLLIRLRPARSELDSRVVFYEAGFHACQSQARRHWPKVAPLIAAGLLAAMLTAPASYRWGHTAGLETASQRITQVAVVDQAVEPAPKEMRPQELRPEELPVDVETPSEIRKPAVANKLEWLTRWIDPLSGLAESASLKREAETTLTAFHGSLASRQDGDRDWIDFPFATVLVTYRDPRGATYDSPSESISPLAVGDLTQLARSLESAQ